MATLIPSINEFCQYCMEVNNKHHCVDIGCRVLETINRLELDDLYIMIHSKGNSPNGDGNITHIHACAPAGKKDSLM